MSTRFSLGRDGNTGSPQRAGPSLPGRAVSQGQPLVQSAPHAVGAGADGAASPAHLAPGALSAPSSPLRSSKKLPEDSRPRVRRPPSASSFVPQHQTLLASSSPELTNSDPAASGLRQHFRPEESPSDVETLHELNPSVVTVVPDFGFSPTNAKSRKAGKKTNLGAARAIIRAAEAASPDGKTKLGKKTKQPEGSGQAAVNKAPGAAARATEGTPVAGGQAAWSPSSAEFSSGGAAWERKLEAPVAARLVRPVGNITSHPRGTEVDRPRTEPDSVAASPAPSAPVDASSDSAGKAGRVSSSEPGVRMQGRAGLDLSPLKLRARKATAEAAEVKQLQNRSPGQSSRTADRESLPFLRVFGIVDDVDPAPPKARPEETRVRAPRGTNNRCQGNAVGESSMVMRDRRAGASAPLQASPSPLLNPTLRALCLEDRTGSLGSGAFVVDDFLSSLAPEPGTEKPRGSEKAESGSEKKVALPGERAGRTSLQASGKEKQRGIAGGADVEPPLGLQSRRCVIYAEDWDSTHRSAHARQPRSSGSPTQAATQVQQKSVLSRVDPQSRFGQVA